MGKHRFIGDVAGNRDHRGQWIGPGDEVLPEPVGAPALCDACGATPDDPECLCSMTPTELRTDGPTLEEYVAAGYDASGYPPHGYTVRETVKTDPEK